ncbi:metal-dependent transcriptional regulator [Alloscardovia theropitheci]|uniref:Manganese transport regulator n=1 Tax=Alloscardovia theropitheci TaxID=2496842 RepID=A0A4R0QPN3_9BIFI|nr:metal-dependent transcriptional regulator [Alloscardovia theropitheci]TCD54202.1 metal-dependent transcriptional regulator [Alloscardovia theropitheci]
MTASASTEDYVKAIWKLHEWHTSENSGSQSTSNEGSSSTDEVNSYRPRSEQFVISPTALARETGMRASTVSGALARMNEQGFVMHAPYGGIQLTEKGEALAIRMLRRHRIIETYLVRALGYTWDQVHEEAESLEHAASDMMIERMEERLGFPDRDPHGDPIPDRSGIIPNFDTVNLNLVPIGIPVSISRVNDDDVDLLQTLQKHLVFVDSVITVQSTQEKNITILTDSGDTFSMEKSHADYVRVSRIA